MTSAVQPTMMPDLSAALADMMEARLPKQWRKRVKDLFMLTGSLTPLTASATLPINMNIEGDSDYVAGAAAAVVTSTDNLTRLTFVPQLVTLLNTGSGRQAMTGATHFHNIYGTGEFPVVFVQPKLLSAGGTWTSNHQNLEATARNVFITFYGFKLFRTMRDAGLNEQ